MKLFYHNSLRLTPPVTLFLCNIHAVLKTKQTTHKKKDKLENFKNCIFIN